MKTELTIFCDNLHYSIDDLNLYVSQYLDPIPVTKALACC